MLIIISSVIGLINREITKRKVKKMELAKTTKAILKSIESKYTDKDLSINDISKLAHISIDDIKESLLTDMDSDFNSVLTGIRVDKSKSHLLNTEKTIEEISILCGFRNPNIFSSAFKTIMKSDPQSWREGREDDDLEEDELENRSPEN